MRSPDYKWVQSCNRDFDPTGNQAMHVQNGFFRFSCRDSTQILEYNQDLLFKHVTNSKKRRKKMFPFLVEKITVLVLIFFSPLSQERFQWILLVVSHSKSQNMTTMMAWAWLSHILRMGTSPLFSNPPFPWCTYSSDILMPWWMSGLPCM